VVVESVVSPCLYVDGCSNVAVAALPLLVALPSDCVKFAFIDPVDSSSQGLLEKRTIDPMGAEMRSLVASFMDGVPQAQGQYPALRDAIALYDKMHGKPPTTVADVTQWAQDMVNKDPAVALRLTSRDQYVLRDFFGSVGQGERFPQQLLDKRWLTDSAASAKAMADTIEPALDKVPKDFLNDLSDPKAFAQALLEQQRAIGVESLPDWFLQGDRRALDVFKAEMNSGGLREGVAKAWESNWAKVQEEFAVTSGRPYVKGYGTPFKNVLPLSVIIIPRAHAMSLGRG